ncbi:hypothetical protein PF011_g9829 [Phytophthora fragariae]|uniref:ABC transmembrane type-1 domain-containing protein n=1 Tax=Phytophthora fragariae TaxID=53985 RepID=A0A6A3KU93_9STRA|nr:hypothetical protein PF011_g9829 [Phytophthora fragariae]
MSKPLVDITIYAVKLSSSIGPEGPLLMISYLMALGLFLPWVRQPTSRFTMTEQQMRCTFRFMKSRLSTHSEENSLTWAFSWSIPKTSNRVCPPPVVGHQHGGNDEMHMMVSVESSCRPHICERKAMYTLCNDGSSKRGQNCVNRFVSDYSSAFIHTSYDLGATVLFQQMNSSVNMVAKWCMNGTLKFFQTTVIKLSFG